MVTYEHTVSGNPELPVPPANTMRFGLVVSGWNPAITEALYQGALETLISHGAKKENILRRDVPGSFELTLGAHLMAQHEKPDAVICLGCVIQGETPHFTYVCQSVTQGITALNLSHGKPFIFGVLTTNTLEQARDRAGGRLGNKGSEAALTAIRMVDLQKHLKKGNKVRLGFKGREK